MATMNQVKDALLKMLFLPNAPQLNRDIIEEYHNVLGHWDEGLLDKAVLLYLSTETYFPTPGTLNNKVLDLQMMAVGIPTAAEAWTQVLEAVHYTNAIWCDEGAKLRNQAERLAAGEYMSAIARYGRHIDSCEECKPAGCEERYSHPAVAETVRLLGGRENLFTDNPAADRKQFIDNYRERVRIEGQKFITPPEIRAYIEEHRKADLMIGSLTKRLETGNG